MLGLGTVKFGRNQKIKYPTFELPSDQAVCQLLDDAQNYGINLLDTAPAYGIAEERLGQLLGGHQPVAQELASRFLPAEVHYPQLARWLRRVEALPGFERTLPPGWHRLES